GDDAAAAPAKGEDRLDRMSSEAAAELARKPESRLAIVKTPGGLTFAVLIVLMGLWPYVLPGFNASTFLEVQRVLVYAMVVMGLNLVAGYAGQLSLGQKIFVLIFAVIFGMVIGALLGLPALRVKGAYLSIVTLAFVPIFYVAFNSQFLKGI